MNIWHDMHPDLIRKEEYTVFTANSMGSTAVLAFDGSTGLLQLEHLSDPYVAAPNNTGYLPRTYTENGMPIETVILCSRPLPPMTLVRCRPVGLITLHLDGGEQRKMLLSAACADAFWSACLTVEDFVAHGCDFLVIGTNDLTQYTHAADRELASAEHYYRPASPAMKKLITMVMDAAGAHHVPVTICGLAVGNPANTAQYLHLGLRSFSVSPQNLLKVKRALLDTDAHPDAGENG